LGDVGAGSGQSGDLRYCITQANQTQGDNTINFSVTGTISLGSALPDLSNTTGLTDIGGPGETLLTLARNTAPSIPNFRILAVDANAHANVSGLTMTGGVSLWYTGGCISNEGILSVTDCAIVGGLADFYGGDIFNAGTLTVSDSIVAGGWANLGGGGICNQGSATVSHSYIQHNGAGSFGGGIYNAGTLTISDATINTNSSYSGGGIGNDGALTLTNSTVASNSATWFGGGVGNQSTLFVTNSTIAGNYGSGISTDSAMTVTNSTIAYNGVGLTLSYSNAFLLLNNSIVALNSSGEISNLLGAISPDSSYNLIGGGESGGLIDGLNDNHVGVDPGLGPLSDNGGPTQTMALLSGSPAIDAGNNNLAAGLATDQRGFPRFVGASVDIGAYEVQSLISTVAVGWGTQSAALQTAKDGLRLLPAGRNTDLPWMGINQLQVTLAQPATLGAGDVTVTSATQTNYGPVTVSGSGTSYTLMLTQPINAADRVTITIGNQLIADFTRRLDVLPGDVNDDGVVSASDMVLIRNTFQNPGNPLMIGWCDLDGDGAVTMIDMTMARKKLGSHLP
jgi:hypothetical protein